MLIDCYTNAVFLGKTISHTKTPDLIYMFSERKHHTHTALVLTVDCVQYPVMQDVPGVPGPSVTRVVHRL